MLNSKQEMYKITFADNEPSNANNPVQSNTSIDANFQNYNNSFQNSLRQEQIQNLNQNQNHLKDRRNLADNYQNQYYYENSFGAEELNARIEGGRDRDTRKEIDQNYYYENSLQPGEFGFAKGNENEANLSNGRTSMNYQNSDEYRQHYQQQQYNQYENRENDNYIQTPRYYNDPPQLHPNQSQDRRSNQNFDVTAEQEYSHNQRHSPRQKVYNARHTPQSNPHPGSVKQIKKFRRKNSQRKSQKKMKIVSRPKSRNKKLKRARSKSPVIIPKKGHKHGKFVKIRSKSPLAIKPNTKRYKYVYHNKGLKKVEIPDESGNCPNIYAGSDPRNAQAPQDPQQINPHRKFPYDIGTQKKSLPRMTPSPPHTNNTENHFSNNNERPSQDIPSENDFEATGHSQDSEISRKYSDISNTSDSMLQAKPSKNYRNKSGHQLAGWENQNEDYFQFNNRGQVSKKGNTTNDSRFHRRDSDLSQGEGGGQSGSEEGFQDEFGEKRQGERGQTRQQASSFQNSFENH